MAIYVRQLEDSLDTELPDDLRNIVPAILAAIRDWPYKTIQKEGYREETAAIHTVEEYAAQLETYVGAPTTKANLMALKFDYSKDAWNAESISELLAAYPYYEANTALWDIISDVGKRLPQACVAPHSSETE